MKALLLRLWHSPTFTTWGSLATRLLSVIFVLPLALVHFSPAEVAVWQLFATIVTLVLILDFGLAPTFSRFIAYARGGASLADFEDISKRQSAGAVPPDPEVTATVIASMRGTYASVTLIALLLAGVGGTYMLQVPVDALDNPALVREAWIAWSIILISCGFAFWASAFAAVLQGLDRIAELRRWEILTSTAQIGTSALVLANGGSLLALVAATQCWVLFGLWRNWALLRRATPQLGQIKASPHPVVLKAIWKAAWRSGVGILLSQGIIQSSGLFYAQVADATALAAYLLALRIITLISQFSQAPFYSKLPRLAALYVEGKRNEQLALAQKGMQMAHWVFFAGVVAVLVMAQPLLTLIGSHTPFVSRGIWALMALAFFAERFGAMHIQLYSVTNHIIWHIANGITGAIMLSIAWLFFPRFGLVALPVGMLVAYAGFYSPYALAHTRRGFGLSFMKFEFRAAFFPFIGMLSVFALGSVTGSF